ncbi:MAG: type II toxin-antitoxin system HicB family antitoxin, partial [Gallionellaceae bacterium]
MASITSLLAWLVVQFADGGAYLITFPDLTGCMSDGETEAEAVANERDVFSSSMSARLHIGKPIPKP